jgi:hypothetical protein
MPRFAATRAASERVSPLLKREGIETPTTRPAPSASTAIAAVSAESIPPESPMTAFEKRFLLK